MTGLDALTCLLKYDNVSQMRLLSSGTARKRLIMRDKLGVTGIYMNALEFNSDLWEIGVDIADHVYWRKTLTEDDGDPMANCK